MEIKYYGEPEHYKSIYKYDSVLITKSQEILKCFADEDIQKKIMECLRYYETTYIKNNKKEECAKFKFDYEKVFDSEIYNYLFKYLSINFDVYENGIVILLEDFANRPSNSYKCSCHAAIVIKDDEISYIVTDLLVKHEGKSSFYKMCEINDTIYRSEISSLGKEVVMPKFPYDLYCRNRDHFMVRIFNKKKTICVSFLKKYLDKLHTVLFNNDFDIVDVITIRTIEENRKSRMSKVKQEIEEDFIKDCKLEQELSSLESRVIRRKKVLPSVLFKEVDDHLVINEEFLAEDIIKYVDFSSISFDNVDVRGIDFSGTNAVIDPQTVYNKDISGCNFTGYNFGFVSFEGVNITNTILDDKINILFRNIDKAINNVNKRDNEIIIIPDYAEISYYGSSRDANLPEVSESMFLKNFDIVLKLIAQNRSKIVKSLELREFDKNNENSPSNCMMTESISSIIGIDMEELVSHMRVFENGLLIELNAFSREESNTFSESVNIYIKDDGISYVVLQQAGKDELGHSTFSYVNNDAMKKELEKLGNELIVPNNENKDIVKKFISLYLDKLYLSMINNPKYIDENEKKK